MSTKERKPSMAKWGVGIAHILNGLGLTQSLDMFEKPWQKMLAASAHVFVAAVMPSFGGIGHKMIFRNEQVPPEE